MKKSSPYNGSLAREQFLFYEVRTTAKLLSDGMADEEAVAAIVRDNLFQYPTEKSIKKLASACLKRLHSMDDDCLIQAIANMPPDAAKQICLYAMMKQNRLVWDFMITVIGEKYRILDTSFGKMDLNTFFMRLAEQDAKNWFSDKSAVDFSIAQLVDDIKAYVASKPKNFRLLFVVDEAGQYVGTDTEPSISY